MKSVNQLVKKYIWLLLGIIISVTGAMVWTNGGYQGEKLWHMGSAYDFEQSVIEKGNKKCAYHYDIDAFSVESEEAELKFKVKSKETEWNYLRFQLVHMSTPQMQWIIRFYDADGAIMWENSVTVTEGENTIETPIQGKIKRVGIVIQNQQGSTFKIENMMLRENLFDVADFMTKVLTVFLFYLGVSILLVLGKNADWYFGLDILQNVYIGVGDTLGKAFIQRLPETIKKIMQTGCFMLMFLLMIVMDIVSRNEFEQESRGWVLLFGALFLLLGMLAWQKPLQKRQWKGIFPAIWTCLWVMVCVSDLLVRKSFSFTGYVMLLCAGFAFFVWHNTGQMQQMLIRMIRGLEWTFPVVILYCICFRPKLLGVLYNGCFTNRESMALYAAALFIAFLTELHVLFGKDKVVPLRIFLAGTGLALSCYYLYCSRVPGCCLAALAVAVIWCVSQLKQRKMIFGKWRKLLPVLMITLAAAFSIVIAVNTMSKILPEKIGHSISYENEILETDLPAEIIGKMETAFPGWSQNVAKREEDNRGGIWYSYIRECNILGNSDSLQRSGEVLYAYNGLLQLMHRYGIFVIVPYSLLLIYSMCRVWKEKDFFMRAVVTGFLIAMLFQNVEIPFTNGLWLMFYLAVGTYLEKKQGRENAFISSGR